MRLAIGIVFLWLGAAGIYVASHSTNATTPYGLYQQLIGQISHA